MTQPEVARHDDREQGPVVETEKMGGAEILRRFAERRISQAVKEAIQLIETGQLSFDPAGEIDLYFLSLSVEDRKLAEKITRIFDAVDHDTDMMDIVDQRLMDWKQEKEAKERMAALAEKIAMTHLHRLPRMSYTQERPERRLQIGILDSNLDNIISALRDMDGLSGKEIDELIALVAGKKDRTDMLFSMIHSCLERLEAEASGATS